MTTATQKNVRILVECAIMLALAFALSVIGFEMPMGGKMTPASMLPLFLVALHLGIPAAIVTGILYTLLQIMQSLMAGNVFVYCETGTTLTVCIVFDYVIPFILPFVTAAVFALLWRRTGKEILVYVGIAFGLLLRFLAHFVSGVFIWGQWAEGMSPTVYSLLYNGAYMLPELILTVLLAFLLMRNREVRRLIVER